MSIQAHKSKHDQKKTVVSHSKRCSFFEEKDTVKIWYMEREKKETTTKEKR